MGARRADRDAGAMTAATLATPAPPAPRRRSSLGRRYGRLWRNLPREVGYLALTGVIGLITLHVLNGGLNPGGGSALLVVAVLLSALLLVASRYLGAFELIRQRWARTAPIAPPTWTPVFRGKRPLRALGDVFANAHYWLYALHSLVLNPLLAVVTSTAVFAWTAAALAFVTAPAWSPAVDASERGWPGGLVNLALEGARGGSTAVVLTGFAALGLLMLALLPLVTRGAVLAHRGLARLLLARFPSEDLRQDVARVDAARTAAVAAEDTALRRLERDIHDGPQQRLLALQMELATAERRIEQEGDATASIETARRLATETLDELRALAQGFAPPLLQDRGLSAALGALGRRGAVPVETAIAIEGDLPDGLERSVYFVAAELVANAVKHAGATRIRLEARTEGGVLRLAVADDGRGGAAPVPGHGLAGIEERLAGLGGTLAVASPVGGPTVVEARVPLA